MEILSAKFKPMYNDLDGVSNKCCACINIIVIGPSKHLIQVSYDGKVFHGPVMIQCLICKVSDMKLFYL